MLSLTYANCTEAFPVTIGLLDAVGVERLSRNGPVLEYPEPVSIKYTRPQERVLFHPVRVINPFLHLFEPLWIIAGQNDVKFLANIVSRFKDYSDDGKTFFSAYGHRLRQPSDQIAEAIERLKRDPEDRRVVLQIRRPADIFYYGRDTACNLTAALKVRDNKLNIHVFNRSNDAVWGGPAGGANFPQFTMLQEYMAGRIGCDVGVYHQTTDSMHVYTDLKEWGELKAAGNSDYDPYRYGDVEPFPLNATPSFDVDLHQFFNIKRGPYRTEFFETVVDPMWKLFLRYKDKQVPMDFEFDAVKASDWRMATVRFFERYFKTP